MGYPREDQYFTIPTNRVVLGLLAIFCLLWAFTASGALHPAYTAHPDTFLISEWRRNAHFTQSAAGEDGVYYFRTGDDRLFRWEGETVTRLKNRFYGDYLRVMDGCLYYTDALRDGFYAYDLRMGYEMELADFDRFPAYALGLPTAWWTDGERYYFLNRTEDLDHWGIWTASQSGGYLDDVRFPGYYDFCLVIGDMLVYQAEQPRSPEGLGLRDLYAYDYRTGERRLLFSETAGSRYGEPLGGHDGELLLSAADGQSTAFWLVSLASGEAADTGLRLSGKIEPVAADGETIVFRRFTGQRSELIAYRFGRGLLGMMGRGAADAASLTGGILFLEPEKEALGERLIDLATPAADDCSQEQFALCPDGTVYRLYAAP